MYIDKVKTKKGEKWRCILEGPRDPVTGKRNQIVRRGKTRSEAIKRAQDAYDEVTKHGFVIDKKASKVLFNVFAQEWLNHYKTNAKVSSVRIRSNQIAILNKYIASTPINTITPKLYQQILNDLHKKEYSESSIKGVHAAANMIFKQALIWQLISISPTSYATIPKKKLEVVDLEKNNIANEYFEPKELKKFLATVDKHGLKHDRETFYLLAFGGFRVGELIALTWDDIDFQKNLIKITKTLYSPTHNMKKYELLPPKTAGSVRTVPMDEMVMNYLKDLKMEYDFRKKHTKGYHGNFVLCHESGYPYVVKHIENRMDRLIEIAKIKKRLTPHKLRHTFVSIMTEAGTDLKTIMDRVGHTDMKTTLKIYTHVTEKMQTKASEKMNKFISDLLNDE